MPARLDIQPPRVHVAGSAPLELMWVIHLAGANHSHGGDFASLEPVRHRFAPRFEQLWDDRMPQLSTELIVLAHRAGTLLDLDLDRFFATLEAAAAAPRPLPSLRSESADEREAVRVRLEKLAEDPRLRARYAALLKELWESVEASWIGEGRSAVIAETQAWTRALNDSAGFMQVLRLTHLWNGRPDLDVMAEAAAGQGRLTLSPCWFGGKVHVVELDGAMFAGRGVRSDETSYRMVAAAISGNIKALADPTRLAILLRLAREPASVTEIARQFDLSQPTVSAHVQILREAGLLDEKTVGRSAQLSASEDGLRRLFANAQESLLNLFRS